VPTQLLPSARRCEIKDAKNPRRGCTDQKKILAERAALHNLLLWAIRGCMSSYKWNSQKIEKEHRIQKKDFPKLFPGGEKTKTLHARKVKKVVGYCGLLSVR